MNQFLSMLTPKACGAIFATLVLLFAMHLNPGGDIPAKCVDGIIYLWTALVVTQGLTEAAAAHKPGVNDCHEDHQEH